MPYSRVESNIKSEYKPKKLQLAKEKKQKRRVVFNVVLGMTILFSLGYQAYALSECNHYLGTKNLELKTVTSEYEAEKILLERKLNKNSVYSKAVKYGMRKADNSQYISVLPKTKTEVSKVGLWSKTKDVFINFYKSVVEYFWY